MTRGKSNRFLLLYASQTGQAKAIAEEVADKAVKHGLHADIHCVSNTEKKFWLERESCVVFISSTTGEGEPPDTALKFWRRLKKKTLPDDHLKELNYILLGLGDSNYTNFCNFAKTVDRRLEELGAKKIIPSTFADDAVGLEVAVEPWLDEQIFPALQNYLGLTGHQIFDEDPVTANRARTSDTAEPNHGKDEPSDMAVTVDLCQNGTSSLDSDNSPLNTDNKQNMHVTDITNSATSAPVSNIKEGNPDDVSSLDNTQIMKQVTSTVEDLVHSLPPLSESVLNIPACPPRFLSLKYDPEVKLDVQSFPIQNDYPFPSAKTEVQQVSIASAEVLTRHDSVKTALKLTLDISNTEWMYQPGDSFGIVCLNPDHEVDQLLKRLDVLQYADCACELLLIRDTKKRNAAVPAYLTERGTLRHWFTAALDIRSVPKKALLRALVEHTADPGEKRRLQELCSKQGAEHYTRYLRQPSVGLADILMHFPSCHPPVDLLLEHLPRLLPRSYSSASCLEAQPGCLEFVFNVIDIPAGCGRMEDKQGICTGMLARLSKPLLKTTSSDITEDMKTLQLESRIKIPVFLRGNQSFHPPADLRVPLIMIGPGTGVAPFIGFLQQRELCLQTLSDRSAVGETWLFFGCRHKDRDYIFRKELEYFEEKNVLNHLKVCFSRDNDEDEGIPRYVQDNMLLYSHDIVTLILERGSEVFVCGDANNMAKDVKQAFVKMIQSEKGLSAKEAESSIFDMLLNRRYHEDVWS